MVLRHMNVRVRSALLVAATGAWLFAVELLLNRISLLVFFVGALTVLSWTAVRRPERVPRRTWVTWMIALALGA